MKYVFNPFTGKLEEFGVHFKLKQNGTKIELWWVGQFLDSLEYVPPLNIVSGNPIGLLLALTYTIE
jgi:hypothetical protein